MISSIKNMIKRLTTKGVPYDSGIIQVTDASYMGKTISTQVFHDYGFVSSVPIGGAGFCLNPRGEEADRVSMFFHPTHTVKDLQQGEVVVGNFYVQSTLHFDEQGRAVLTLPDDFVINCKNLTATCVGDATVTSANATLNTGSCDVNCDDFNVEASGSATLVAPTITLDGFVSATSGLGVSGSMENNGVDIGSGHKHTDGTYKDSSNGDVTGESGGPV